MSTVVKYLKLAGYFLKFNLQSAMEYRGSFLIQVLFMFFNNLMLLVFWWAIFYRFGEVRDWAMGDVVLLYAVVSTAFGISVVLFGNAGQLSRIISEGRLDYYLALPKDPFMHVLISRMFISGVGDVLFGILIFFFGGRVGFQSFVLFVLTSMVSAIIFASFWVITHSLSFFLGNSEGLSNVMGQALMTFSLYPRSIFTGVVKFILFTIIPAGFVSYLPVSLIKEFNFFVMAGYVSFAVGMALLARWMFSRGLKRYESGNLIVVRM